MTRIVGNVKDVGMNGVKGLLYAYSGFRPLDDGVVAPRRAYWVITGGELPDDVNLFPGPAVLLIEAGMDARREFRVTIPDQDTVTLGELVVGGFDWDEEVISIVDAYMIEIRAALDSVTRDAADVERWHGDVQGWHPQIEQWHSDVDGWQAQVSTDAQTAHDASALAVLAAANAGRIMGTDSPEGVEDAPIGTIYVDTESGELWNKTTAEGHSEGWARFGGNALAEVDAKYGSLLWPLSIGSTQHLNELTTPGKYRTISSTVAGNTSLGYPEGAVHGILLVERVTTNDPPYLVQTLLDTWNMWAARRRLYQGSWSGWTKDVSASQVADLAAGLASVQSLVNPPSLGSNEDLNTVMTPGRKKASSSSITGNAALHYPPGAAHGYLDTVQISGSYVSHMWTDVYADFQATRRYYNSAWSEWKRLGGGSSGGSASSTVQAARTIQVASDYRPDVWAHPAGTVAYWTGPRGTERIRWDYQGEGYVGRIGKAARYTSMQIKKVQSDNEIEVSCLNPTTGRHVTFRVQGTGGGDDQRRFEEAWIGPYSGTTVTKETLILPRSNIEWAFQVDIGGDKQFAPYHTSTSCKNMNYEPAVFTDGSGFVIDLDALGNGDVIENVNGLKVRQRTYIVRPDTGTTRYAAVDEVKTITPDGMVQSEAVITFLVDTTVGNTYGTMTPVDYATFDNLHVLGGASYPVKTTPPSTTEYVELSEGHDVSSVLFTSTNKPNAFVASAFLDPAATLAKGDPMEDASSGSMRFEQRSSGLTKLYPNAYTPGSIIPAGTVWRPGAQWRYGETSNPSQYI